MGWTLVFEPNPDPGPDPGPEPDPGLIPVYLSYIQTCKHRSHNRSPTQGFTERVQWQLR